MKLSIIIPIYKVEDYLRKCIDSVLNQDLLSSEYEIILVDDGSPDACPVICDQYAAEHDNVCIIHQKNGGLSAARNAGLRVAKGEYVCFVDSDDYWEENILGRLMMQIDRDNLDVLRFKYQNVNENGEVFNPYKRDHRLDNDYSESVMDGVSFLNSRMNTQCYAVMFVVRRAVLFKNWTLDNGHLTLGSGDCLFTEGIYFEDTDWTPRMLCRAKRVASTDTIVYNYLVRQGSITRSISREKQQKVLEDKIRLVKEMQWQAEALRKSGRYNKWYYGMIADTVVSIFGMLSVEFYNDKDEYLNQLASAKIYPIVNKSLKARLINLSPRMAVELLHWKNGK